MRQLSLQIYALPIRFSVLKNFKLIIFQQKQRVRVRLRVILRAISRRYLLYLRFVP